MRRRGLRRSRISRRGGGRFGLWSRGKRRWGCWGGLFSVVFLFSHVCITADEGEKILYLKILEF